MEPKKISEITNEELVEMSGATVVGTPSGLKAQYAQAELTRRLMESIKSFDESTARYSKGILALTFTLLVVGLFQIAVTVFAPFTEMWIKVTVFSTAAVFIGGTFSKALRDLFE